jgi:succinate dehydrogenase / fumarate reductase, cytochrome b subunit
MTTTIGYFRSTIGRKQLMALAGLGLCLFVLSHTLGNFLLFVGPEAYNLYAHKLTSNPLIYLAEAGLVAIFLLHAYEGVLLSRKNKLARPQAYAVSASGKKGTSLIQKTMVWQGVVILVFVVMHIMTFKYGEYYEVTYGTETIRDLFKLVHEVFQHPVYVAWYVVAVLMLAFHLSHGFYSSLQTLGLHHPTYTPKIKCASLLYGIIIGAGFAAQPLYMMFIYQG